ncbi:MAG: hypothetical protein LBC39_02040 [Methanobrevibacter sp.]|jgi:hypothetical protein|nr:hypothetical protein [Candidatus Methanovirga aequatorialis]
MKESNDLKDESRSYKREKQKGERWDGYLIRSTSSFQKLMPYLMNTRDGSSIYFKNTFDATRIVEYLNKKNEELNEKVFNNSSDCNTADIQENFNSKLSEKYTYNHFFMTAITRVIAMRPHLNRFIAGKKIYQRHNIELAYVVKKQFSDDGEESVTISKFERDSNIYDVVKILNPVINGVKDGSDDEHGDFLNTFLKFPSFIVSFVVTLMNFFIVLGHCPVFLRKMDVMQCSAFVSNLGSIDLATVPIHHLYDRGTCSVFITVGKVRKVKSDHVGASKKYEVEISVTMDERVTDGFYLINSLKVLQEILNDPEQLNKRLKEVPMDV